MIRAWGKMMGKRGKVLWSGGKICLQRRNIYRRGAEVSQRCAEILAREGKRKGERAKQEGHFSSTLFLSFPLSSLRTSASSLRLCGEVLVCQFTFRITQLKILRLESVEE
jgi:hypothetical protein